METLRITNFLTIAQADICLNRFNVFIGPQARGKSIVAKLIYFFKKEVGQALIDNAIHGKSKRELTAILEAKFEAIFPRAYWGAQEFSICYTNNLLAVCFVGKKTGAGKVSFSTTYSEPLLKLQKDLKKHGQHAIKALQMNGVETNNEILETFISLNVRLGTYLPSNASAYASLTESQIFIPASRTFFANLQKNIFSFLAKGIDIDPFLKDFGSVYENAKRLYSIPPPPNRAIDPARSEISTLIEPIIAGSYLLENEQDWIVNATRKINLANVSSGQQEALPMLLVLAVMPFLGKTQSKGFYIEEPEAHLFPVSQKQVVSLLVMLANTTGHQFFITTHSPYILTALNNCILAASASAAASDEQQETIAQLMPKHYHLPFANVGAWTVTESGVLESILDEEAQLIGASLLDTVSQEFEGVSNALLDIMYGD